MRRLVVVLCVVSVLACTFWVPEMCAAYTPEHNLGTFFPTLAEDLRELKAWMDDMDDFRWGLVILGVWIVGAGGQREALRSAGRLAPSVLRFGRSVWRGFRLR